MIADQAPELDRPASAPRKAGRRTSPLTAMWREYARRPSDETRNRLVEHYQPLVQEVVRRFAARLPRIVDRGDLDTAANFGLIAAIEAFDPTRGVRFEAYCDLRVRGALLDELRNQDWLSRAVRARREQHKRSCEDLRSRLGREPSEEELAEELGLGLDDYRQLFTGGNCLAQILTGAAEHGGDDGLRVLDIVADPYSEEARERLTRDDLLGVLAPRLNAQEQRLVYLKYWEELSMREIGARLQLSESRVSKIHTRLLERLKERLGAAASA